MARFTSDARLFGVDLRLVWSDLASIGHALQSSAALAWLTPQPAVRVLMPDGSAAHWLGAERPLRAGEALSPRFIAVALPEDLVLHREIRLPSIPDEDLPQALALQAAAFSPFAESDLVWGYRAARTDAGALLIDLALASRRQVEAYLQQQTPLVDAKQTTVPEVWVFCARSKPIVLAGFGEPQRLAYARQRRRWHYVLLAGMAIWLAAIAVTPSLQLRARAVDAYGKHQQLVSQTAHLVKARAELMQANESLTAVADILAGRIEPLRVLDRLTQVLPDDTALQGFTLKGQQLTLTGLTANASVLMQILGEQTGIREVKAPSAAIRVAAGASAKENFVIELALDPAVFGVAPAAIMASARVDSTPAAVAADSANSPASAPVPTVVVPPKVAASPPVPAAGAGGGSARAVPSFGGGERRPVPPANPGQQGKGAL